MYVQLWQCEQKRSKTKTRSSSEKTKKLKQRDQLESFTDEGSVSNSSVSCSSPMDDTKSKKRSRSRDKKRRKDKKRSKKSRLASESSGYDSPRVKKWKRSKKNRGSDSRKKRSLKRQKRDQSVSSSSRSRSPCEPSDEYEREYEGKEDKVELKERKGREKRKESSASKKSRDKSRNFRSVCEPNDDSERDYEGKEEEVESKERKGREKDKERSASKSRDKSRSYSPSKLCSEGNSYCSEDRELENNNPKRLKSVIIVTKDYKTDVEQDLDGGDGHKDEIVCDFDDYPNKSNDSNDGVSGREVVSYSHEISSLKRSLDDPNSETVASDIRTSEVPGIQSQVAEGSHGMTSSLVRSGVDDPLMGIRSEVSIDNASTMGNDLEAILRQKALENLLKRQGKLSTKIPGDKKANLDIELKKPSIVKVHSVNHHKPHDEENIKSVQKVGPTDSSGPSKDDDGHLLSLRKENDRPEEKGKAPGDFVNNRPNIGLSTRTSTRKELLGAKNTWKRQLIPQKSSQKNPSSPREMIVNDSKQQFISQKNSQPNLSAPQETMSKDSTKDSASPIIDTKGSPEDVDAVAAYEPSASGERSTNDKTNETDEEAQFQQKTMSVMRGGEMVEVSYKVYIPKKIPALARRQLKR